MFGATGASGASAPSGAGVSGMFGGAAAKPSPFGATQATVPPSTQPPKPADSNPSNLFGKSKTSINDDKPKSGGMFGNDSLKPNPFGNKPEEKKDAQPSGGLFGSS